MNMVLKKTLLKWMVIGLPLVLFGLLCITALWLLKTSSGANWIWSQIEDAASESLSSLEVEGDLSSGFVVHGLKYTSPDMELTVRRTFLQVEPGFFPLSLQVGNLELQEVVIVPQESALQEQSEAANIDVNAIIEALKLPLPVFIHHAEISNLVYGGTNEAQIVIADQLTLKLSLDEQLSIDTATFLSPALVASAEGSLALETPFDLQLSIDGELETADTRNILNSKIPFSLEASGDLKQLLFQLESNLLDLQLDGELNDPTGELAWDISAVAMSVQQTLLLADEEITVSEVTLNSIGSIDNYSLDVASDISLAGQPKVALILSATGSDNGIQINRSSLAGSGLEIGFNGQLDWSPQVDVDILVVIGQLDLSPWVAEWPETTNLTGELGLNWSEGGLKIPRSNLSISGTNIEATIAADIDLGSNHVFADLGWSNLRWPLQSEAPDFSSSSGQMKLTGTVGKWESNGQFLLQLGKYPEGVLHIKGSGGKSFAEFELLDGQVLGGSLNGTTRADWLDGLNWSADIQTHGVDPEPVLSGWPGKLDLDFSIEANSADEHLNFNLSALSGILRGTRLGGQGGFSMTRGDMHFNQLALETDDASLTINGSPSAKTGLAGKFNGSLPSLLLQGASGQLEMEGVFSSHVDHPTLELRAQALDLAWSGLSIKALEMTTGEKNTKSLLPAIDISATELSWESEIINELTLSLRTENNTSTVQANIASELLDLSAVIGLTPDKPDDIFHSSWQGVLSVLDLIVSEKYRFGLREPAPLTLSANEILLQAACLQESSGAELCLGAHHQTDSKLAITADLNALPVDYVRDIFELDLKFEQMLEGKFEWHQLPGKAPTGGANLRISQGRVLDLDENEVLLQSNEGVIRFKLQNGNLESGTVDIEFPDVGFIDIDFEVLDIINDEARALKGRALSRLNNIGFLGELLLPGVDEVSGQFESNISLQGTLTDPAFEGGFKLTGGFFHYVPLGLKLEDVGFSGKVDKLDRGSLKGQFKAGDGIGSIKGRFKFDDIDNLNMDLSFSGDQLLLVNTDSLSILTDSRLEFGLSPQRLDINGVIKVPRARLTPENLLLETVSDSEDLVIETRSKTKLLTNQETRLRRQFFGNLEVSFGNDVYVKVPDVTTSISGKVMFNWTGEPVPVADGVYRLQGTVDVYGPKLEITNGSISFPGVPANNPLLNIRAQRDIYGNTQIRSAGVQVIGTLQRPVLEAYTVPVTNEDRAWTLLVTGSDFEQGQGVGGFDIGTYIMPKLYVSYGISLFEDENVISARYDLKKGFGIKVTSGQRETGLDMSYTIDK